MSYVYLYSIKKSKVTFNNLKIGDKKMKNLTKLTVTILTIIAIFCVTTVNAEVVLEDTFNNVTDGSEINSDLGSAGRQSGTIAPTN